MRTEAVQRLRQVIHTLLFRRFMLIINDLSFRRKPESREIGIVIPAKAGIQKVMKNYYVYILSSKRNGTLYTGVTSDIIKRVYEHKQNVVEGFTNKYNVHWLVWYEIHDSSDSAINREKQIKKWKRAWKLELIEKENPEWVDLYESIC